MYYDKLTSLLKETRQKIHEFNQETVSSGRVSQHDEVEDKASVTVVKKETKQSNNRFLSN